MNQTYPYFTPLCGVSKILGPGNSRSTCLLREKADPTWPRRRRVSGNVTAYVTTELLEWAAARETIDAALGMDPPKR